MSRLLRWLCVGIGGLLGLAVIAYGVAYVVSERALQRIYSVPRAAISIPMDAASIAEGERLATVHGCFACHGQHAQGAVMFDDPMIARLVAPNLTAAVRRYNDSELVAIIRNGVRPGGRSMLVMPSEVFAGLTDADLGSIIAFLKSLPPSEGPVPGVSLGPVGRFGVTIGKFKVVAQLIAETVPPPVVLGEEPGRGRYLARTICAQCHGTSLRGDSNPDFTSPTLATVAAYSPEAFTQLMRSGDALGGRRLPTMSLYAQKLLSRLTDAEIAALYSYLHVASL